MFRDYSLYETPSNLKEALYGNDEIKVLIMD